MHGSEEMGIQHGEAAGIVARARLGEHLKSQIKARALRTSIIICPQWHNFFLKAIPPKFIKIASPTGTQVFK